jgi:hypothetical protein
MSATITPVSQRYKNAKEAFYGEKKDGVWNKNIEILSSISKGSKIFQLLKDTRTDEKFIGIIKVALRQGELSYSAETEKEGPFLHDAPLSLLKQSTCSEPVAVEWRKNCLVNIENAKKLKAKVKSLKKGNLVKMVDGRKVSFVEFKSKMTKGSDEVYRYSDNPDMTKFRGYLEKEFNNIDNKDPTLYVWKAKDIAEVL